MDKKNLRVYENVLEVIGATPLIKLNKVPKDLGVSCKIYAKAEFMNPGGSIKDRTGANMLEEAEKRGDIYPGYTIVESTSGNTGIGLALACCVRGYNLIVTIPDKMSKEKIDLLKSMGAKVIITDTSLPVEHPDSYVSIAKRLGNQPNHFYVDQYNNEDNPRTHYKTTANELNYQMEGKIDYIFIGSGTCGTITGIGKRIKELIPTVKIVGVDPVGSQVALPVELNKIRKAYKTEGMGQSYVPKIMDQSLVDDWVKIDDLETLNCARDLISKEGLLVGGSAGSIVKGALNYLIDKNLSGNNELRCIVILPDSVRNYISKFVNDSWMVGNSFYPISTLTDESHPFNYLTIADIEILEPVSYYDRRMTVGDCFELFSQGLSIIPIRENSQFLGIVTKKILTVNTIKYDLTVYSSCLQCLSRDYLEVPITTSLSVIHKMIESYSSILVTERNEKNELKKVYVIDEDLIIELLHQKIKEIIL